MQLRMANSWTIRVTGLDMQSASKAEWRQWLKELARDCQDMIAIMWDMEMTGTGRPLKANTPAWTAYKIAHGWSPKRGQRKGRLLRAIEGAALFDVSAVADTGTATITFNEGRLVARVREKGVAYVPYYVAAKVPIVKRVLQMNQAALERASALWRSRIASLLAGRRLQVVRATTNIAAGNRAYSQIVRAGKYGAFKRALDAALARVA